MMKIGQILLQKDIISQDILSFALWYQRIWGGMLGEILVANGFIEESMLIENLSEQLELKPIYLDKRIIPSDILSKFPSEFCESHLVLPFGINEKKNVLKVAMVYPLKSRSVELCYKYLSCSMEIYICGLHDLSLAMWHNFITQKLNKGALVSETREIRMMVIEETKNNADTGERFTTLEITEDEILQEMPIENENEVSNEDSEDVRDDFVEFNLDETDAVEEISFISDLNEEEDSKLEIIETSEVNKIEDKVLNISNIDNDISMMLEDEPLEDELLENEDIIITGKLKKAKPPVIKNPSKKNFKKVNNSKENKNKNK